VVRETYYGKLRSNFALKKGPERPVAAPARCEWPVPRMPQRGNLPQPRASELASAALGNGLSTDREALKGRSDCLHHRSRGTTAPSTTQLHSAAQVATFLEPRAFGPRRIRPTKKHLSPEWETFRDRSALASSGNRRRAKTLTGLPDSLPATQPPVIRSLKALRNDR
jgi:hypothetical protein